MNNKQFFDIFSTQQLIRSNNIDLKICKKLKIDFQIFPISFFDTFLPKFDNFFDMERPLDKDMWKLCFNERRQNVYTVKIDIKLWGPHPSRNQSYIWYQGTITTTYEKAFINLWEGIKLIKYQVPSIFLLTENFYIQNIIPFFLYYAWWDKSYENFLFPEDFEFKMFNCLENIFLNTKKFYLGNFYTFWKKNNRLTKKVKNKNEKLKRQNKEGGFLFKRKLQKLAKYTNINIFYNNVLRKFEYFENIFYKYMNFNLSQIKFERGIINNSYGDLNWMEIREAFSSLINYKDHKGVYIFWNTTKNKYYVGQTKNLYKRICIDHFNNKTGEAKNENFKDDYNFGDIFYIAIKELPTKDDLDKWEKYYIDYFDSFYNGYNKTSGNY